MTNERIARNLEIIDELRANGGTATAFPDVPLLVLSHVGARSGEEYLSPVAYLRDGERYVIFGANGGRDNHPAWYHNLLARPRTTIEIGTQTHQVVGRVAEGEERRRLWERQIAASPMFAGFQERTTRQIPAVVLEPAES